MTESNTLDASGRPRSLMILMDQIGTSGILATRYESDVFQQWGRLITNLEALAEDVNRELGEGICSVHEFSDTVLVVIRQEALASLELLFPQLTRAVYWSVFDGVFVRGSIAFGEYVENSSKFLGRALEEAAAWHEATDWIGLIASPSLAFALEALPTDDPVRQAFVKYPDTPLKGEGKRSCWVLDWVSAGLEEEAEVIGQILLAFHRYSGVVDPKVHTKYVNTIKFMEYVVGQDRPQTSSNVY